MKKNDLLGGILALNGAWIAAICHYLSFFFRILNKNLAGSIEPGCDFKLKCTQFSLTDHKMSGKDVYWSEKVIYLS